MAHFSGRIVQSQIATRYNYHDFSHFRHVIPIERVSFTFSHTQFDYVSESFGTLENKTQS